MADDSLNAQVNSQNMSELPADVTVAMAYIPYQNPTVIYSDELGIEKGTLFPSLDKPFLGCEVSNNNE